MGKTVITNLGSTLQGKGPRTPGQQFLLSKCETQPHDGRMRHDGSGNRARSFSRREQLVPKRGKKTYFIT